MSKNLPETQPSEEVDLGQLLKLIGNSLNKLFRFIGDILYKCFLAFVWVVFFTKKHIIKLGLAVVIGVVIGLLKEGVSKPMYKSAIVIQQNYNTGEQLYNTINYYNSLIQSGDSIEIAEVLRIKPEEASSLKAITLESNITNNQKLLMYDGYLKNLDSVLALGVKFESFLENTKDYTYKIQKITLRASIKDNFNHVLRNIIEDIEKSEYLEWEKEKLTNNLIRRDSLINASLEESQALQEIYLEVLKEPIEESTATGGTTNIAIGDSRDKKATKEFELFNKDLELKRELADNAFERDNLEKIFEIIAVQNGDGTLEKSTQLLGRETSWTIALSAKFSVAIYLLLLLIEFVKFLERYKDKVI